jgi:multiple sugar transport system substrate-binding protein
MKNNNMKKRKRVFSWTLVGLSLILLVPLLAACSPKDTDDPNNRRTLRIGTLYGSKQDDVYFRQQYTDMFEFSHKGIDIEVVPAIDWNEQQFENLDNDGAWVQPDQLAKVKEIMTGANPVDVMIFDLSLLNALVEENLLLQLDPLMKEDKIDANVFVPSVIEAIREQGNGNIYALTPTFMPFALYYNKKLFNEMGVTPPQDGMSWDDVFNLARQMSKGEGKDAIFGLTLNPWGGGADDYWQLQSFASPLQLKLYDSNAERMTINTPQWKALWEQMYQLYKDKVIPSNRDMYSFEDENKTYRYNPYQGRLFLQGRVAMTLGDYSLINDIMVLNDNADKLKMDRLDWDVVTVPYHTAAPGVGVNVSYSSLAGINAKAQNQKDAWEFVKFINGEEWAKFKSRSTYEMSSRIEFVKPREGLSYNVEAFIKMKPAPAGNSSPAEQKLLRERPNLSYIQNIVSTVYSQVFQDQRSIDDALKFLDEKGNDLLQKIKEKPTGEIEGVFDDLYTGLSSPAIETFRSGVILN